MSCLMHLHTHRMLQRHLTPGPPGASCVRSLFRGLEKNMQLNSGSGQAERRYRVQKDYRGVLPQEVQAMFDHAKSLERGRRGRQLSNMLSPDLAAALEAYEAAIAAMDASVSTEGDVARVLEGYAARAAAVREQLTTAEAKVLQAATFDESRRSFQHFSFDTERHDIVGTTAQVLRLGHDTSTDLSKLHDSLSPDRLQGPPPICPALLCALARERKLPPVLTHVRPGASTLYVRATRTNLLRAVRTGGAGSLPRGRHALYVCGTRTSLSRAVRTAYCGAPGCRATGASWPGTSRSTLRPFGARRSTRPGSTASAAS